MSDSVTLFGFETSNNMKVRIALNYKGIPYQFVTIDPKDRTTILKHSGQRLTPTLRHGEVVLFDSGAIIRYLEANFPDTPKLFGSSHAEQWEIEDWELFGRVTLAGPMMELVHTRINGGEIDDSRMLELISDFHAATETLIEALESRRWLVGDSMTAADVTAAPVMHRIQLAQFFPPHPTVGRIDDWLQRVMSYDRAGS